MAGYNFISSPYAAEEEGIRQQMRYAQALQQQGLQPDQGQMVSGHYVAPSWTQGLAKLGAGALSGKAYADALTRTRGVADKRHQALVDGLMGYKNSGDPSALLANPELAPLGIQAMTAEREAALDAAARSDDRKWRAESDAADRKFREEQAAALRAFTAEQNDANRLARVQAAGGGAPDPYYQFLPGADGYLVGNARTGQIAPGMVGDQRAVPGALDPTLQGQLAGAKESGKIQGQTATQAQIDLPGVVAGADQSLGLIDKILGHPGMAGAVGAKNWSSGFGLADSPIAGSKEADFMALKDQLAGKQFLEAFQSLKGGGQITEVEGKKATDAIAAMQTSQSEEGFRKSAEEFKAIIDGARQRAIQKARGSGAGASGSFDAPSAPPASDGWQDMGNGVRVRIKQ